MADDRYDFTQPGSGLASAGITDPVKYFDELFKREAGIITAPTAPTINYAGKQITGGALTAGGGFSQAFANVAKPLLSAQDKAAQDAYEAALKEFHAYQAPRDGLIKEAQNFLKNNPLTSGSLTAEGFMDIPDEWKINMLDWVYRDMQRNNQKAKSGILDSVVGKIAVGGLFSAFGAPLLSGLATGAGLGSSTIGNALISGLDAMTLGTGTGLAGQAAGQAVKSGFTNVFGSGSGASSAAANAVPGAASGVNPASLGAMLGPSAGTASGVIPGAGGISTAAGAGTGAAVAGAAGAASGGFTNPSGLGLGSTNVPGTTVSNGIFGPAGVPGSTATLGGAATGAASGVGAAAITPALTSLGTGGTSLISTILSKLGGASGLTGSAKTLLEGVLGQLNSGDLEKLAQNLNAQNQNQLNYLPPISYRDNILANLNMIMNNPGQLMDQGPYKDYMDYAQRAVERKMVAQGYGGVGQSTNTADAVTRAVLESMAGIIQRDREIATQQLLPFFNVGIGAASNMNNGTAITLQQAANAQNAGNWANIINGGLGVLGNLGIFDSLFD